jgi:ribosome-associated protein
MFNPKKLIPELSFKAMRSSGSGGQHVNKVSSKMELHFSIPNSHVLSELQKARLLLKLKSRLTNSGELILQCDQDRSQHRNKDLVIDRFLKLIAASLVIAKKRKPTKPSKGALRRRVEAKQKNAAKKEARKKPNID